MSAEVCLHFAATFLGFFLKVTAAYFACSILNRLVSKPGQRFIVWMIFLIGSAAYWLELVIGEVRDVANRTIEITNAQVSTPSVTHSFLLPLAWSHSILIVIQALAAIYVLTSFTLLGITAWKHLRMRVLLSHAIEPSAPLNALLADCEGMHLSEARISRPRLLVLPGLKSPATAGWWSPRILLPEVCEQIGPTPQVADVLCHELVHVARRDYLWARLSDLICCLLFFHPAAWKARKAMALQAELACDLAVLETRAGDRADYADSLTYFVRLRMLQEGFSLGVDFAASTSLGLRIRTILTTPEPVTWWKACWRAAAGVSLIAAVGVVAPFMALSLGLALPHVEHVSNRPSQQLAAARLHNVRHVQHRASTPETPKDSLTTLRTQHYVPETPAYAMTSSSSSSAASAGPEQESPAWQESQPVMHPPSVSSVIRTTLGEIAARGTRSGRGRDRDDH